MNIPLPLQRRKTLWLPLNWFLVSEFWIKIGLGYSWNCKTLFTNSNLFVFNYNFKLLNKILWVLWAEFYFHIKDKYCFSSRKEQNNFSISSVIFVLMQNLNEFV